MTQTTQSTGHLEPNVINGFVDGELSGPDTKAAQNHLNECHGCALQVLTASQLKRATVRACVGFAPPLDALARLTAQVRTQNAKPATPQVPSRRVSFSFSPVWSAIAASLIVAVSIFGWSRTHQANALAAELLDEHLAMLSGGATPEVVSSDRHTVKPWFQGRLPFSFNLPEPENLPPDTTLRGADLVYVDRQPEALLIFEIHKHDVSVFVTQRAGRFDIAPRSSRSGFTVRSVTAAELRLTAVSDVDPAALDALVSALAKVQ